MNDRGNAKSLAPVLAALSLPALLALPAAAQAPAGDQFLVRCARLVVAPDVVLAPGELLIRDGQVAHVGDEIPDEVRGRVRVADFGDATIVPGLVLAHTMLEQAGDLGERSDAWTPELRAAEGFDPCQDPLLALPRAAVTSCVLAPASTNVAGGIAALVKPGELFGRVAEADTYLKLSLAREARDTRSNAQRPPTSLMGAIELMRSALQGARQGMAGGPAASAVHAVLRGQRRAFVHADTFAEVSAALDLAGEFEFEPVLVGAAAAEDCVARIGAVRAAVALRALRPDMRPAQLELPARLEAAGIPFCFVGEPAGLRAGAALAVRHGTSRPAALAAITRTPAELAGVTARVGSLRRGCDADFAVFGGDPLDLGSPLHAVYVDGVRLHGQPPQAPAAAPADTEEMR